MNYENLNLEKFSGYGSKVSRKISITKSFSFGIPPALFKENNIDGFEKVALFFDKKAGIIGLNFNNNEGFKLAKYGTGDKRAASFLARSFFTGYGLDPAKCKGRYVPDKINREGIGELFLINLESKALPE